MVVALITSLLSSYPGFVALSAGEEDDSLNERT